MPLQGLMPAKSTITWASTKALSNRVWTKHTTSRRHLAPPSMSPICPSLRAAKTRASQVWDPWLQVLKVTETISNSNSCHNRSPTWQHPPSTRPPSLLISRSRRMLRWVVPPRMPRALKVIAKPATSLSSVGFSRRFSEVKKMSGTNWRKAHPPTLTYRL